MFQVAATATATAAVGEADGATPPAEEFFFWKRKVSREAQKCLLFQQPSTLGWGRRAASYTFLPRFHRRSCRRRFLRSGRGGDMDHQPPVALTRFSAVSHIPTAPSLWARRP
jgi:hypothetical protein